MSRWYKSFNPTCRFSQKGADKLVFGGLKPRPVLAFGFAIRRGSALKKCVMSRQLRNLTSCAFVVLITMISVTGQGLHLSSHCGMACGDSTRFAHHGSSHDDHLCSHAHSAGRSWVSRQALSTAASSGNVTCHAEVVTAESMAPSAGQSGCPQDHDEHDCSVCRFFALGLWTSTVVELPAFLLPIGRSIVALSASVDLPNSGSHLARGPPLAVSSAC